MIITVGATKGGVGKTYRFKLCYRACALRAMFGSWMATAKAQRKPLFPRNAEGSPIIVSLLKNNPDIEKCLFVVET